MDTEEQTPAKALTPPAPPRRIVIEHRLDMGNIALTVGFTFLVLLWFAKLWGVADGGAGE